MTEQEKLKAIAQAYVDALLKKVQSPDADIREINECIRTLHFFGKMGLIQFSMPEYSQEPPGIVLQTCPIAKSL